MKRYVVGFPASTYYVLLIKKNRPNWQKGKYNGIGGHIEKSEKPIDAMVRECEEETGLHISKEKWEKIVIYKGKGYIVHFYVSTTARIGEAIQKTDEELTAFNIQEGLPRGMITGRDMIYNLNWLLPLAYDGAIKFPIKVEEKAR